MATKKTKTVALVYTGRRLDGKGRVYQRFEDSKGKEYYWRGRLGVYLGYSYEAEDDKMAKRPARVDVPRIDRAEWEAADAVVDAQRERERAEKKYRKQSTPTLRAAVDALVPLIEHCDLIEVGYLTKYLISEAMKKAERKKEKKS